MANVTRGERDAENAHKDGAKFFRFTLADGTVHEYVTGLSPVLDTTACRVETGLPLRKFLPPHFNDLDSVAVLFWLAQRQGTEPGKRLPRYAEVVAQVEAFDLDGASDLVVEFIDPFDETDETDETDGAGDNDDAPTPT